ncbi:LuxR C-terminal-related transcriptional regulator [Mycolicibacterium sp. F2034L]|uniref:LuxR C-terminal-related transcriptional regulator n=1 Tax=Mycolicibacterium sp. F2034L TaxID=2926422 RepID=UPI001FF2F241|nr:LuxR C-terminal-related transcriptional regulator [Mycolicibacterium sp. F2034L]MCK0172981.1 LuxR C-terminal-related transcriptional regulator [Mycolicibacterium sp. F2034L]
MLDAATLAFDHADVMAVARRIGRSITPSHCERIMKHTGGWPSAVRLALMTANDSLQLPLNADMTEYIRTSVLGRMRPVLAEFVLTTTVANRLDARLARTLSERHDGGLLLEECVSAGFFIDRFVSEETTVYQWHSMFSTHCRTILRNSDPARWHRLNAVAATELAQRYPLPAVEHAIRAGDAALTTEILAQHWLELLLESRSEALENSCVAAMTAFGESSELLMIRACCRDVAGDSLDAAQLFARAREHPSTTAIPARMQFTADLTKVLLTDDHEAMVAAADRAERALSDRTVVAPAVYACAMFVLGWANSRLRRGRHAAALLESAVHECRALGLTVVAERARQTLAFATAAGGEFDRALRVIRHGGSDIPPDLWLAHDGAGIERFTEGYVHFWRGRLTAALDDFTAMHAAAGAGYPDVGRMMLAFTVAALADESALSIADAAVTRIPDVDSHGVPWPSYKLTGRARLAEFRGDQATALELVRQLVGRLHIPMMSAIGSGIARRLDDPDTARSLAEVASASQAQPYSRAYGYVTLALLDWQSGDEDSAHRRLERGLALAAPEEVRLPFVDNCDRACVELLARHTVCTSYVAFLNDCRVECEAAAARHSPARGESLTAREREVLAYLRTSMTTAEIAASISVSVNTLKTHQRAIYRKLGAANRREAIRIAGTRR